MKTIKQDKASKSREHDGKPTPNDQSIEDRLRRGEDREDLPHDMPQTEIRIDPGFEQHHRTDADDKIFDDDIDRAPRNEDDMEAEERFN